MNAQNIHVDTRPPLPNKAFDSEYATQFHREMLYLKERGIDYAYVKKMGEYRIPTFKYTKTPELFRAVADFYEMRQNEKVYEAMDHAICAAAQMDVWSKPMA